MTKTPPDSSWLRTMPHDVAHIASLWTALPCLRSCPVPSCRFANSSNRKCDSQVSEPQRSCSLCFLGFQENFLIPLKSTSPVGWALGSFFHFSSLC